jgi:hypothetical protein
VEQGLEGWADCGRLSDIQVGEGVHDIGPQEPVGFSISGAAASPTRPYAPVRSCEGAEFNSMSSQRVQDEEGDFDVQVSMLIDPLRARVAF